MTQQFSMGEYIMEDGRQEWIYSTIDLIYELDVVWVKLNCF